MWRQRENVTGIQRGFYKKNAMVVILLVVLVSAASKRMFSCQVKDLSPVRKIPLLPTNTVYTCIFKCCTDFGYCFFIDNIIPQAIQQVIRFPLQFCAK